jgi:trigger factor
MRTRLAQQGIAFDEYLASNDQTESDLRRDLSAAAEGRVRNTLVLQEVAKAEEMQVTDEDLDAEIDKLVAGRPNPDQLRLLYRSDYFRGMLENELHDRKLMELVVDMATEGRGAITGPGADLLEADQAPPEVEVAEVEEPEAGEAEEDAAEMAAGPADVEADEPGGVDAEADVDDDEPPAEAADGDAVEEAVADDEEEKPGR